MLFRKFINYKNLEFFIDLGLFDTLQLMGVMYLRGDICIREGKEDVA